MYENVHLCERMRTVDRTLLICKFIDSCFYEEYLHILFGTFIAYKGLGNQICNGHFAFSVKCLIGPN